MDDRRTPSKPKPTDATTRSLMDHYHSQLEDYNAALVEHMGDKSEGLLMERFPDDYPEDAVIRDVLIERIRRQNHRLGRNIKGRAHELLLQKTVTDDGLPVLKDGRTVGLTYAEILKLLAVEFPEASTSAACLRWYVVHMRTDASDEGLPWPALPQIRPRSSVKAT